MTRPAASATGRPATWEGRTKASLAPADERPLAVRRATRFRFAEYEAFVKAREEARGPEPCMDKAKICAIRERLRADSVGIGSEISVDSFFLWIKYTSSDLGVTDREILDLIAHIDVNGDRMIQREEFDAFCDDLIGV